MIKSETVNQVHVSNKHDQADSKTIFGFWVYLMTDCVLFASLFATYAVLRNSTYGGPDGSELFSLPFVLTETMLLLTSSFMCGLAMLAIHRRKKTQAIVWLLVTFLLGFAFLALELTEFRELIHEGNGWDHSGFLSAFFTLVATHGLHISVGLLWGISMTIQLIRRGFTNGVVRRLTLFSLFWHFLDIIWIFIYSIVYLLGVT